MTNPNQHGPNNPRYNGGLTIDRQTGRCRIVARDRSLIYFYRAVMNAHLGRELLPHEHVHHINGDCTDDRIENLQVIDMREHISLHSRAAAAQRKQNWQYAWSFQHERCIDCGTTQRCHMGHGRCERCYYRYRTASRDRRAQPKARGA